MCRWLPVLSDHSIAIHRCSTQLMTIKRRRIAIFSYSGGGSASLRVPRDTASTSWHSAERLIHLTVAVAIEPPSHVKPPNQPPPVFHEVLSLAVSKRRVEALRFNSITSGPAIAIFCLYFYLFFTTTIFSWWNEGFQKRMQLGSPNMACKCFTMGRGNSLSLGSKDQGHEPQKHCRRGSLNSCECWRFLVLGPDLHTKNLRTNLG